MRLYRSKGSPFYSSKGVTANEEPVSANDVKTALESCGFYESKVYSISGVTYKYVDHKMASLILPVYNFIERILDLPFLRKRIGSFLITFAKK